MKKAIRALETWRWNPLKSHYGSTRFGTESCLYYMKWRSQGRKYTRKHMFYRERCFKMYHLENIQYFIMHFSEVDNDESEWCFLSIWESVYSPWSTPWAILVSLKRFLNCFLLPKGYFISYSNRCPRPTGMIKREFLFILGPYITP